MSGQRGSMARDRLPAAPLAGVIGGGSAPAAAQQGIPDFSAGRAAWVSVGGEWTPLPDSGATVKQDPAHRYVPNNTGGQPTFRVADTSNPNLTQFAKNGLKQANDDVF